MAFVHEDPAFDDLLRIVAERHALAVGLVEKDYWVTHTLWAIHNRQRFALWFKGGTSLSKGFGLIQRFSEDLDVKIEAGAVADLPQVSDWTREGATVSGDREAYFEQLAALLDVPDADVSLDRESPDRSWRSGSVRIHYPGRHLTDLGVLRPFVLLEVGSARVTPYVERDLSSFVHDYLVETGELKTFDDNRPRAVRCVHPLVTLVEKLDALHRRVPNAAIEPAVFVRHYEDSARIIGATGLPALAGYPDTRALIAEMLAERQIRQFPAAGDPAFAPTSDERWDAIRAAYGAIAPMFWGERIPLDDACALIREWAHRLEE